MTRTRAHRTEPRDATVLIIVPRERGSVALESLDSIRAHTPEPHRLIYVDGGLTRSEARAVRRRVRALGGEYVRSGRWLYPNEARNRGLARAGRAEHVVFLDNDVLVEPGWLGRLLDRARRTGAGVVGPLYLEGDADDPRVHCAGGSIERVPRPDGTCVMIARQRDLGLPLREAGAPEGGPTGLVEFHCVLVSRALLDAIGGRFDEGLKTTREHVDLCLLAARAGFAIHLEPESRVRYAKGGDFHLADLDYYMFRWSDRATVETIAHFEAKWGVALDPERRRGIRGRRQTVWGQLRQRPLARRYVRLWQRAQRSPGARGLLRWAHRELG